MAIITRTFQELNNVSIAQALTMGYTDAQYAGTGIRTIIEATNISLSQFYSDLQANVASQTLSQASGAALDALALLVGVIRYAGESDQNLLFRVTNALTVAAAANLAALLDALYGIAGVRDVIVKPFVRGIGTVGFYLLGTQGMLGDDVIQQATMILGQLAAAGASCIVMQPTPVTINMTAISTVSPGLSAADATTQKQLAASAIAVYLSNLNMGSPLIVAKVTQVALDAATNMTDFQILTLAAVDSYGNVTELLIRDYTPSSDEELVPGTIQVT